MLETRQLRYFLAVADTLHFGRAADRLNVAQSAVSAQILQLEAAFGVRLLNRGKRAAVSLTQAGQRFLADAQAAARLLDRAEHVGHLLGRGEVGRVEVGFVTSVATSGVLARLLGDFRATHGKVELRVATMDTPQQLAALAENRIDVGLIRPWTSYPQGLRVEVFHREGLCVALASDHPLVARQGLYAADLSREAFIVPQFDESAGFANSLTALGQAGGFAGAATYRVGDFVTALSMASGGYGVVLGPISMAHLSIGELAYRPLLDYSETVDLAVAWRATDPSPAVAAFATTAVKLGLGNKPIGFK
jgi:DNA-binding transcriptional LysR family regulator